LTRGGGARCERDGVSHVGIVEEVGTVLV
jgi:hypothetical protein